MRSFNFHKKRAQVQSAIPVTSLPDIIFILLLFFMVTTTLREVTEKTAYALPFAASIDRIENRRLISHLWIGKDGSYQINDAIVSFDEIQPIMYGKATLMPQLTVSLLIDKNTPMETVSAVQTELRRAYCLRIFYATEKQNL